MNLTSPFSTLQSKRQNKIDITLPLKRSVINTFQFDPASPAKNLKNIFTHQNSIIDQLFTERDDLIARVQDLEERLASSLQMIAVQKSRIMNLSDLSARLSSIGQTETNYQSLEDIKISEDDKLIVEQVLKLTPDQIPLYLAHNPFPLQCAHTCPNIAAERIKGIMNSLPPEVSIPFASAAFAQLYRSSEISELVEMLRKSIYNLQFIHKIENFCCKLFKASFCQLFSLEPQQNQLVTIFDKDGFTLQVPVGQGIVGICAKTGKALIFQSTQDAPEFDPEIDSFFKIGTNPSMLIPIFDSSSNFVISVILVHTPKVGALFTLEDHQIGKILSDRISPFLTNFVENVDKNEDRIYRNELSLAVKTLLGKNKIEDLLQTTTQVVQRAIKAQNADLYLIDEEQGLLYMFEPQSTSQDGNQLFVRKYFSGKAGLPFQIIETLAVINISRVIPETCEHFSRETDVNAIGKPYVAVPVFAVGEKPIAILAAYGVNGANIFSPSDISALQQIAVQIGINLTNIFTSQQAHSNQAVTEQDDESVDTPVDAILEHFLQNDSDFSITEVSHSISNQIMHTINCDLVGVWRVIPDQHTNGIDCEQAVILKSGDIVPQKIVVPPVIKKVAESGEIQQSAVAADVQQMISNFDIEIGYKSYSNVTFPVKDEQGKVLWVIMVENSLSSQGRFTEADINSINESTKLLQILSKIIDQLDNVKKMQTKELFDTKIISNLEPVKADVLKRVLISICEYFDAKYVALFQADGLSDQLSMVESNYPDAPKSIMLTQGLIGKLFSQNESQFYGNIYNESEFNAPTDAFGIEDINSAIYVKLTSSFILVLLSPDKNKFNKKMISTILGSTTLIEHSYELGRNFNEGSNSGEASSVSAEQRASFMSKSSSPTRSDLEEYSDRLFNIVAYGDDDRIIMLLKMFVSQGVIRKLQVPFQKLVQFICTVRSCYNDTPYHNWTHACDVTQFIFSCVMRGRLRLYLQDIELFALLLAAVCHDLDHHGLNNAFHKKARTPLGILYDERPVMEMHHCATAIRLLEMPDHNVLEGIETWAEKSHFYEFFIKIILATDMDKHFAYIKEFEEMTAEFDKRNERHRLLLAQIVMKCGDVSNTTRAFDVASDMSYKLTDEFFKQGDTERSLGLEVTPMCDRTKASHISTSQVGFYGFIASPLLAALGKFIPALVDNSEQLEKNKRQWEQQKEQYEASQAAAN